MQEREMQNQPFGEASKEQDNNVAENSQESPVLSSVAATSVGVIRDLLSVSIPAVETSFTIARTGANVGFGITRQILALQQDVVTGVIGCEVSSPLSAVDAIIHTAQGLTEMSLGMSEDLAKGSLQATDSVLSCSGVETGETARLLTQYVESQRGNSGFETKEAILGLAFLLGELTPLLQTSPFELIRGASDLVEIQKRHRAERLVSNPPSNNWIPPEQLRSDLSRFILFAAAAYGYQAAYFLDMAKHMHNPGIATNSDIDCILAFTGIKEEHILLYRNGGELYKPAHYVALDHQSKSVVVAIRGTMSLHDVLVDLVCESDVMNCLHTGTEYTQGQAHKGMLKAAKLLASELHVCVAEALDNNPSYRLVICGHSLGAGVAALIALLWAPIPLFQSRCIHAFTYGSPCTVCHKISQAPQTQKCVTSVVIGDDVVSRLSLSSFKDLQRSLLSFSPRLTVAEKAEAIKSLPRETLAEKLFCPGKVIHLESVENGGFPHVVDPVETLHYIEVSGELFAVHLPLKFLESIKQLP